MSTVEPRSYEGNAWVKLGDARVGLWQMNGSLTRSIRWLLPTEDMEGMPPLLVLDRFSLIHRSTEEQEEALLKFWPMSPAVRENFPAVIPLQYLHRRALLKRVELPSVDEDQRLPPLETLLETRAASLNRQFREAIETNVEKLRGTQKSRQRWNRLIDCYQALGSQVTVQRIKAAENETYTDGHEECLALMQLGLATESNDVALVNTLVQLPFTGGRIRNGTFLGEPGLINKAIRLRRIEIIRVLAGAGFGLEHGGYRKDNSGHYPPRPKPLEIAIDEEEYEIAQLLLDHGAEPKAETLLNRRQWIQPLLDAGADPFCKTCWGTPLYRAAQSGLQETCQELLNLGADPCEEVDIGRSPLHVAILRGRLSCLKLMLETRKLDDNWRPHPEGLTLLEFARSVGRREVIDYLEGLKTI